MVSLWLAAAAIFTGADALRSAAASQRTGYARASTRRREQSTVLLASDSHLDDRYASWKVDVKAFEESRENPWVYVDRSPGAGLGVFAARRIPAGTTVTEYVGCLAPTPDARTDELELQQAFYGDEWRAYSQRYEIGLSGSSVADAAGGGGRGGTILGAGTEDEYCDVDEGLAACLARAGESDYVLLGKVPAQGACPEEGVAQLINDHTALLAPGGRDRPLVRESALDGEGAIRAADVDGMVIERNEVPLAADVDGLERAVARYIANTESRNNVALCQAPSSAAGVDLPRVFAVATRPIEQGDELRYTYGVEWWLAQLRRAALAQLVACGPSPQRAAALEKMIRAIEFVSCEAVAPQAEACARAGCMPRAFVVPLERLAPLDELLADDSWQKVLLSEEFVATECSVEELYADAFEANYT